MTTLPEWAEWLARGEYGKLWAFAGKPSKGIWGLVANGGRFEVVKETDDTFSHIRWEDEEPTEMVERPKEGGKTMPEKPKYFIDQPVIETHRGAKGVYLGKGHREDDASTAFVRLDSGEILVTSPEYIERTNTFTCSQVVAGLAQDYFKEGTRFHVNAETIFEVTLAGSGKLGLRRDNDSGTICINLYCSYIHATWTLISEGPKEMTLSEIEEALGHRVKIKEEF